LILEVNDKVASVPDPPPPPPPLVLGKVAETITAVNGGGTLQLTLLDPGTVNTTEQVPKLSGTANPAAGVIVTRAEYITPLANVVGLPGVQDTAAVHCELALVKDVTGVAPVTGAVSPVNAVSVMGLPEAIAGAAAIADKPVTKSKVAVAIEINFLIMV
jgi:hypothetical protein